MTDKQLILTINPGSTSTKIAIFDGNQSPMEEVFEQILRHSSEDLAEFDTIIDQYDFRLNIIMEALTESGYKPEDLAIVVGRGGLVRPVESGSYLVNDRMISDLRDPNRGAHASNLGAFLAKGIADEAGLVAMIVDPVVVDELTDVARLSGLKDIERTATFHALNQKAVARRYCKAMDKKAEDINLIVVHLGGGISIGSHEKGRIIEVPNALYGEGPFSPERSGALPAEPLVRLCFSGKYTEEELLMMIHGQGGMVSYLGTNSGIEVADRIKAGDKEAELVFHAMAYQVAKEVGAAAAVLRGQVDAIIITGGMAYNADFVSWITDRIDWIAPIEVYPGEDELLALAEAGQRVLLGEEEAKDY